MSSKVEGPFWLARPLELPSPKAGGKPTLRHHLGSTAAVVLRDAWRRLQAPPSPLEYPLTRFGCSVIVLVHKAEVAAAIRDEETGASDPKLARAVRRELERYIPECNKVQFQDSAPVDEQPTQPISVPLISANMFGGVQVAPRDGGAVHFIARLDDTAPPVNAEDPPCFPTLHAERQNLLSVIHEVTGYGPTDEEGVGIAIGSIKAEDAAVEIPYNGVCWPASQVLQVDIAKGILGARKAVQITPATAGPLCITPEV